MPDRWPTMVGVVGFDGGYRPAVALALPPAELTSDEGEAEGGGDVTGACCFPDGACGQATEDGCIAGGGAFQGIGTICEDFDCSHTGACCDGSSCRVTRASDCLFVYQGDGTDCDPNPCPPDTGSCCVGFDCTTETAEDCADLGGIFSPNIPCDPNPCCTYCDPLVWQGCNDGGGDRTGPESCDGCGGEIVTDTSNWYTDIEYCIDCPDGGITECCRTEVNTITCEVISTCPGSCGDCGGGGSTHEMRDQVFPCGACCIAGECSVLPEEACTFQGGAWLGVGSNCLLFPCGMMFSDPFFAKN